MLSLESLLPEMLAKLEFCCTLAAVTADEVYKQIGARIRRRRRSLRILQADLAQKAGLSRGSISNIEAGRQQLYVHHLVAIANALRQEPGDLLEPTDGSETPTARRLLHAVREGTTARRDRRAKQ